MKIRRSRKGPVPHVEATSLTGTAAIASLRKLSDEALDIELTNATTTEAWLWTTEAALRADPREPDALADLAEHAAAYCRVSREVMLLLVAQRVEQKKDGGKKGEGYL
jgi:2-methylcitrate dehydratase PrpD